MLFVPLQFACLSSPQFPLGALLDENAFVIKSALKHIYFYHVVVKTVNIDFYKYIFQFSEFKYNTFLANFFMFLFFKMNTAGITLNRAKVAVMLYTC